MLMFISIFGRIHIFALNGKYFPLIMMMAKQLEKQQILCFRHKNKFDYFYIFGQNFRIQTDVKSTLIIEIKSIILFSKVVKRFK